MMNYEKDTLPFEDWPYHTQVGSTALSSERAFDIPVRRVGTKTPSILGCLLGLPLTGPGDEKFKQEMAEIAYMERTAASHDR